MSKLEVVPFDKELLKDFVYDGAERKLFLPGQIPAMTEFYSRLGKVYIARIDGKVIGVGGLYPLWEGAGSVWLFLNAVAKQHKVSVFKAIIKIIKDLMNEYQVKTLIVECISDSPEANNLVQHLGFVKNREVKMALYFKSTEK